MPQHPTPYQFEWPFNQWDDPVWMRTSPYTFHNSYYVRYRLSSLAVTLGVGVTSKIVGGYLNRVKVHNKKQLVDLVTKRPAGQSLITVSNHYSCMDDPLMWGSSMSLWTLVTKPHLTRFIPSARDICFTKRFHTWFFRRGRCVPVTRGDGVYQKGMDFCIHRLNNGDWVHMFSEGGINLTKEYKRLKWGIGRLIMDTEKVPIVLPMFHIGYDDILPNNPPYIPRIGKRATILVGEPMDFTQQLQEMRDSKMSPREMRKALTDAIQEQLWAMKATTEKLHSGEDSEAPPTAKKVTGPDNTNATDKC